jgi:porin
MKVPSRSRGERRALTGHFAGIALGLAVSNSFAASDETDSATSMFSPSLTYDGAAVNAVRGGAQGGTAYVGNLHLRVTVVAAPSSSWVGTSAFVDVLSIHGGRPSQRVGDAQGVSNIEGPHGTVIEELWTQHNFETGKLSLLAGIYDLNSEFYRLQAANLFLNSSFGIGTEFGQSGAEGPSIFPRTSVGLRVSGKPAPNVVLRAALLDGVPVVRADGSWGAFRSGDGLLAVAEAAFLTRPADADEAPGDTRHRLGRFSSLPPYQDKLAVGLWHYSASFPELGVAAPGESPALHRGSSGAYAVGERRILGREESSTQTLAAFVQLGVADAVTNRFGSHLGAGLVGAGWGPGKPTDQVGVAITAARNGSPYTRSQQSLLQPVTRSETTVELSYLTQVTSWLTVQPDLQYVVHPNTDPSLANAWVLQLRFELTFQ